MYIIKKYLLVLACNRLKAVNLLNQINPLKPVRRSETAADHGSDNLTAEKRERRGFAEDSLSFTVKGC